MNTQEALREAKKRWGKNAAIEDHKHPTVDKKTGVVYSKRFRVGYIGSPLPCFCVEGNGDNWAEAFRMVDNRNVIH
jgi:hypothetical protein